MLRSALLIFAAAAAAAPAVAAAATTVLSSASSAPVRAAAKQVRRCLLGARVDAAGAPAALLPLEAALARAALAGAGAGADANANASSVVLIASLAEDAARVAALGAAGLLPARCLPASGAAAGGFALCADAAAPGLVSVVGVDAAGAWNGAIAALERLFAVSFGLDGAQFPTRRRALAARARAAGLEHQASPVFALRGLQPFHDFDEGPDIWSEDEHKRVYENIATMKGNFIGFHTYPIDRSGDGGTGTNEPAVWLGVASDVGADGSLASAYPTAWATTRRAQWGMQDIITSDYGFGADQLFSADCFGHPAQSGDPDMCPFPVDAAHAATLFNRVGALWKSAFAFAHAVGVKTCLGTESPMSPPPADGGLAPLNMYYSATRGDHFATTTACDQCDGAGYVFLGVAASVLSQPAPGAVALSTYYNGAVFDNMLIADGQTVPPGYDLVRVEGYAMPAGGGNASLSDLLQYARATPKPDHFAAAAGSALAANASASGFASAGVIAQVWPASAAPSRTSQDYYEGALTRLNRLLGDTLDYYWIWTPEDWEWSHVDINNSLVQDVVKDAQSLQAARDAVYPSVTLASCGWVVGPAGFRSYFDSVLPPGWSMSSIDMDVGNTPVDPAYMNITNHPDKWVIPWMEDDPGLTAPELWLNRTLLHAIDARAYNATGLLGIHWRTRAVSPQVAAMHGFSWDPERDSLAFWGEWALGQFGPSASTAAAAVFSGIDSFDTPRPVNWRTGPGTLAADGGQCAAASGPTYAFVDAFEQLRALVALDIANGDADLNNLERFDYWAASFEYMRGIARFECDWAAYNAELAAVQKIADRGAQIAAAQGPLMGARASLVANASRMMWAHLARVSSLGDLGTITNVLSQSVVNVLGDGATATLLQLANLTALPDGAAVPRIYDPAGAPLLRVNVVRGILTAGEPFRVEAFVLASAEQAAGAALTLFTAPVGGSAWSPTPMARVLAGRAVFSATVTGAAVADDFQWYIAAALPSPVATLVFPPTAPDSPQFVAVV